MKIVNNTAKTCIFLVAYYLVKLNLNEKKIYLLGVFFIFYFFVSKTNDCIAWGNQNFRRWVMHVGVKKENEKRVFFSPEKILHEKSPKTSFSSWIQNPSFLHKSMCAYIVGIWKAWKHRIICRCRKEMKKRRLIDVLFYRRSLPQIGY